MQNPFISPNSNLYCAWTCLSISTSWYDGSEMYSTFSNVSPFSLLIIIFFTLPFIHFAESGNGCFDSLSGPISIFFTASNSKNPFGLLLAIDSININRWLLLNSLADSSVALSEVATAPLSFKSFTTSLTTFRLIASVSDDVNSFLNVISLVFSSFTISTLPENLLSQFAQSFVISSRKISYSRTRLFSEFIVNCISVLTV